MFLTSKLLTSIFSSWQTFLNTDAKSQVDFFSVSELLEVLSKLYELLDVLAFFSEEKYLERSK